LHLLIAQSVKQVIGCRLDSWAPIGIFLLFVTSRQTLGPIQSPMQRVPGVKQLEHEAVHLLPLVPRLKMHGVLPLLPPSLWCSAQAHTQIYFSYFILLFVFRCCSEAFPEVSCGISHLNG
jgi:hypothetical protein